MTTIAEGRALPPRRILGSQRRLADLAATIVLWAAACSILVLLAFFIGYLTYLGAGVISWHFLTSPPSEVSAGGGIGPEIFNSFYILFLTLIFTVPIAMGGGIYLQEYARPGMFTAAVQFCAESLATIPSIVMGLFGLIVFVTVLRWHFTALGGALTLTLLNLPALMRVTQEGLSSVPLIMREGSMALGATKWQTIRRVVLPSAIAPLTTGIVLIAGRIFGETAALIYTAGVSVSAGRSAYDWNPFHTAETLSVHLWYTHSEGLVPDADRIGNGSALVLLVMILGFNILARVLGRLLSRRLTSK
ncbi:MAG: phosphate ABC transporter permease PstA [Candidatus Eremiobacteraeota bacterium]|nr:phosphate ABC transporter permease PstA [Candidatus Eremiobacteraeota bacterium]